MTPSRAWRTVVAAIGVLLLFGGRSQAATPIGVVAAENFYGDVARQIGGEYASVTSILNNPDQDPHLFEAGPSTARAIAGATIVIENGIDYDPWVDKLLGAARNPDRETIVVAGLIGKHVGDNPHVWDAPAAMLALASALTADLDRADPAHRAEYERRQASFRRSLAVVEAKIAALRRRVAGAPVTATEPVFGYMFDALGLRVRNGHFQVAVMNGTEPSASEVAAFEDDLRLHRVKLLLYNGQASDPMAQRMRDLAVASGIPIVAATETEPPGKTYQTWMLDELAAVDRALVR